MTKEEWLKRCAARYVERGGLSQTQAEDAALCCFDGLDAQDDDELAPMPESCADDDMSYWTHDEEETP